MTKKSPPPIAVEPTPDATDVPRRIGALRRSDVLAIVGAVAAAISLSTLIYSFLAPVGGALGYFVTAYILFLAVYAVLVSLDESLPIVRDRVVLIAVHSLAVLVFVTLVFIVLFATFRGLDALPHLNFFTQDMSLAGPLDPLSEGGIIHAITGTLIQISIALAITIPLGLTTAVFLNEIPGAFSRFVRTIVEAMTALPSIVAGLFIYATLILMMGIGKSGFAASMAISVMMLPIMIRASDVVLRLVPGTLKEAALGLGANNWHTMWRVTLPTARSGLVTAIILATARGIGETSPVLLTSGFTAAFNANPLNGPMISLPLAIFQFVKSPEPTMIARGFGTAAVLMLLVVTLFIIARVIGGQTVAKKARARERRQRFFENVRDGWLEIGGWFVSAARGAHRASIIVVDASRRALATATSSTKRPSTAEQSATVQRPAPVRPAPTGASLKEQVVAKQKAKTSLSKKQLRQQRSMKQRAVSFEDYLAQYPGTTSTQRDTRPTDDSRAAGKKD